MHWWEPPRYLGVLSRRPKSFNLPTPSLRLTRFPPSRARTYPLDFLDLCLRRVTRPSQTYWKGWASRCFLDPRLGRCLTTPDIHRALLLDTICPFLPATPPARGLQVVAANNQQYGGDCFVIWNGVFPTCRRLRLSKLLRNP